MELPLRQYLRLLAKYLKPQSRRSLLMGALLLTSIGLQLANPQVLRYFIDTATGRGSVPALMVAALLFIGIALTNQGISILARYFSEKVAWTATNRLRTDLVAHCLDLDMAFHKEHTSGEMIERIDGDVNVLSNFFSKFVVYLLGNAVLMVGVLLLLFQIDWRVGLSVSLFALLALYALARIRGRAVPAWTAERQLNAEFYGFLGEQLAGTEDIRGNGATGYVMRRFQQLLHQWYPVNRSATMGYYMMGLTTLVLFAIGNALAFALGAYLWSIGKISLGTVYIIFYYTNLLTQPIEQIRMQLQDLQKAGASILRVEEMLRFQPSIASGKGTPLPEGALAVEFRHVEFSYTADTPVLQDISFTRQPGKVLGVLGRTGSGKTTLARLLLRLYDIQNGEIRVGHVPVSEPNSLTLRQRIGMVTQEVQLFHASVRDNLTFFNPHIPDSRIIEALDDLGLTNWYRSLPNGLDTELCSDGEGLSAGEAQLLAFTRVFLADPGLVILDEASSRLDPATERHIEQAVSKLLGGRTGILIAHRLGTIARADEVMILEHGHIIEYGEREKLATNLHSRFYSLLQTGLEEVYA